MSICAGWLPKSTSWRPMPRPPRETVGKVRSQRACDLDLLRQPKDPKDPREPSDPKDPRVPSQRNPRRLRRSTKRPSQQKPVSPALLQSPRPARRPKRPEWANAPWKRQCRVFLNMLSSIEIIYPPNLISNWILFDSQGSVHISGLSFWGLPAM